MRKAEVSYRKELASRTIADLVSQVERTYPETADNTRSWFANLKS
jgi:DNA-binding IscR family transcriptional regulator